MPSPFPGMDPYLERPTLWPDVHHELISEIRVALNRQLGPRYFAQVQERIYISTEDDPGRTAMVPDIQVSSYEKGREPFLPAGGDAGVEIAEPLIVEALLDEEVREPYLEVINVENHKVITVIEVLSPDNKVSRSRGLKSFRLKRETILRSSSHWVELDLLRLGARLAMRKRIRAHEYLVHVSPVRLRAQRRPLVWPIRLSQRLPAIPIPLRGNENVPLDLQTVVETIYDRVGYARVLDYGKQPVPPLSKEWREWADQLLLAKGLRGREPAK